MDRLSGRYAPLVRAGARRQYLLLALLDSMQQAFDNDRQRLFSESPIDPPKTRSSDSTPR